ncbi:PIN domain-containing protein [Nitratireductor sp. CAU 1489]|uniref:PIN domain-containing protein n=1 Tax=Nitratireductor arenosus TaxID=2682096 RepID=A0A844QCI5_9HYPH|nr:type II toxin-antitoxin system VapC family toxin [Nitratireductor arenosus]MVA95853.1 PIN domain-containing protein [Nitratireductor arenosus]
MSDQLLLDTCALIWIALNEPIKPEARAAMSSAMTAAEKVRVSPISAWELGLLSARGRLAAARSPMAIFGEVIATEGVRLEPLSPEVLIESSFLPGALHRDPADRILIATARSVGLTIVTRDQAILDYAQQGHVRALPC